MLFNFIPDLKKIKIYSNKRNVKHLKRIFLALEVGKKRRMSTEKERREGGAEQKEKVR